MMTLAEPCNSFPPQVKLVLSALEAGRSRRSERRQSGRSTYRIEGRLFLHVDPVTEPGRIVYGRDVNSRSFGLLSPARLPLGYGGVLHVNDPDGNPVEIACTVLRCREAAPGWFDGCVYFNRAQPRFDL